MHQGDSYLTVCSNVLLSYVEQPHGDLGTINSATPDPK